MLVGFKQPVYTLARATRSAILSRSRERQRIASLRGTIHRQFAHADALLANAPARDDHFFRVPKIIE